MTPEQEQLLNRIATDLATLQKSDRYTFEKPLQLLDGRNIQVGKSNGTKIGTEALQKLGFWGVTPVIQQSNISNPSGGGTAGVDSSARTAINSILNALEAVGITAS